MAFAHDLIEAIPECACLYLLKTDLIIPNSRWVERIGDVSRLADFSRFDVDVRAIAENLPVEATVNGGEFSVALDPLGVRRLVVTQARNHPGLFIFLLRDDTELRRVEQMRKDFIANVSHELRTPLTAVRGYVETLLDPKFMTTERVREFLPIIFEHTERLHNLMLDLLSLSRLENPNTQIMLSAIPLVEELEDAVEATAPLARMKNIRVEIHPSENTVEVVANTEHLERILVNLLDNAIKYSAPGGRVAIRMEIDGNYVWTHVKDEGQGIPTEELPRVFERFYRTKGALGGRERGSGLGLAIVKHIVQQLGGEIKVDSILGQGSDFSFSLRVAGAEPMTPGESEPSGTVKDSSSYLTNS
jgi:two-component system phosphate regulon sensor histidine kinase PhoR